MNAAVTAYIGIGSNLTDPQAQVQQAVKALSAIPETTVQTVSPWYRSSPVGGPANQPDYINGVACLETTLAPHALLGALQSIEQAQGRERREHWGARTLDLDLLLYGQQIIEDARLSVPHPRLHERSFVLVPLADIAPHLVLPNGSPLASLLRDISTEGLWPLARDPNTDNA